MEKLCNVDGCTNVRYKHGAKCYPCHKLYNYAWRKANPERVKTHKRSHKAKVPYTLQERARQYGLTTETLKALLDQGCGACGSFENLHVDHDHNCCPPPRRTCGKCTRGVLCHNCNLALGLLDDSAERIAQLGAYLQNQGSSGQNLEW